MIDVINIIPHIKLRSFVNKISIFRSKNGIKFKHKLTPSAFTYLSYNIEEIPVSIFGNKKIKPDGRLQLAGPKVSEDIWVHYNGNLTQALVEFTASGFYYLFHLSPESLVDRLQVLESCVEEEIYNKLVFDLSAESNAEKSVDILQSFLVELSYKSLPKVDYVERGISHIEQAHGNISITNLAEKIGISKRQFDRKFHQMVGVSAKYYAKITQLNHVLNIICSRNYSSIQDLAFQGDFYDLPHFLRTFKKLTGLTPNEFIKSDRHIAMKYFNEK